MAFEIKELFVQKIPGFGTVRLEQWPDSIVLAIAGYIVCSHKISRPKPELTVVRADHLHG